jgi:UDP-glucose 4-epimerase
MFRAYHEQHGLDYVGLRYMNVYGPRMDYKGTYVSVIMKVLDKIEAGERPVIFGDGSQAYDFVHVGDVARANILAMKSDATDVNLNVGTGVKSTIKELVTSLLELSGGGLEPEYRADEQMFVTHRVGSTELSERLIGFRAQLDYEEGLRSVIEWRSSDQQRALEQPA